MHANSKLSKREHWQLLIATFMGTFFDGMDASIFVLGLFPTFAELLNTHSHSQVGVAASFVLAAFMVGWTVGSVIFGTLADRIGRVRTMVLTILLYAICTGLCATAHNIYELAVYRFLVGCGIGGEISVTGVLIAESWSGKNRYIYTGIVCSAFGFGYLGTALLNLLVGGLGWRALYLTGMIPALLTIYIRMTLKEPAQFKEMQAAASAIKSSATDRIRQLFTRQYIGKTMAVVALASTCIVGYWAVLSWIPPWVNQLIGHQANSERSTTAIMLNLGSIVGAISVAYFFPRLGHKKAFMWSFAGALVSCLALFLTVKTYGIAFLSLVFAVGLFAEAPFVPLFIYVPELFPVSIRVTAFGTGVQAGRLFAATAAIMAGQLIALFGGSYAAAGACISLVYIIGLVAACFMPKSTGEVLAETPDMRGHLRHGAAAGQARRHRSEQLAAAGRTTSKE